MASQAQVLLKIYFIPFLTPSHSIPLVEIARLFAARGVDVTIVSTMHNALVFQKSIDQAINLGHKLKLQLLKFPWQEVGLPEGIEHFNAATSIEIAGKIFRAFMMLQQPMEQLIRDARPDCIVADMHYYWASDFAAELGIPRLVYHARTFLALCAADCVVRYVPHEKIKSDDEYFVLPNLPGEIRMRKSELPDWIRVPDGYTKLVKTILESDAKSYGAIVNSVYELEKEYADHYVNVVGIKAWGIGPTFLGHNNKDATKTSDQRENCLSWLDSHGPESVVYVSFGSLSCFSSSQLMEIALALDSAGHPFLWVVRKGDETSDSKGREKWLPEGFEEKMKESNKGLILRNWVPQMLILEHPAVGAFLTQCGSNSVLESMVAGVPMLTCPISSEQFYTEKLLTQVLKIGMGVGNKIWGQLIEETKAGMKRENLEKGLRQLLGGGEGAAEMRRRAKELSYVARRAVEEGGSSYNNLTALIEDLERCRKLKIISTTN